MYVNWDERDDEATISSEEREGWYVQVNGGLDVFASGPGERQCNGESGGEEWRCTECGERFDDTPEDEESFCDARDCEECDGASVIEVDGDPDRPCPTCKGTGHAAHTLEPVPLSWANSAHITLDPERDAIYVSISVGDPRGRFVMGIERYEKRDADGEAIPGEYELRMSTPYPGQGWSHMPLTKINEGYFRIGN